MMNWRRRYDSLDGLIGLGLVIVAWVVSLVGAGFALKLMWKIFLMGWNLV